MLKGNYAEYGSAILPASMSASASGVNPSGLLGGLCFAASAPAAWVAGAHPTHVHIAMPCLGGPALLCEEFTSAGPLQQGRSGALRYCYNDAVLFGVVSLTESDFPAQPDSSPLQTASQVAYRQIFSVLQDVGFPYVYRFWNYLAAINAVSHGLERYRQFNHGRQQAFTANGRQLSGNVPAACALGTSGGPLTVAFLAGRLPSQPVENPRQLSAYDYPQQYGPSSPLFSRASMVPGGARVLLFLSGTASILGHASLHAGDVRAQTRETLANIQAVLEQANRQMAQGQKQTDGAQFSLASLHFKVYMRRATDLDAIRHTLSEEVGSALQAVYIQADICRRDLLVEIEGTAGLC